MFSIKENRFVKFHLHVSSVQNVRPTDSHLTQYLLKVFSHSREVSCFASTDTPWQANQKNAISDTRASAREPLFGFPAT